MESFYKKQLVTVIFFSTFLVLSCSKKDITVPVQYDYTETVGCLVTNDFYAVHFSAYIKPEADWEEIKGKDRNKLLRSYCKEIPRSGSLYFTADLADSDAREMPITVRFVKQELIGEDDKKVENLKDISTIFEVPARLYPQGMVETQVNLESEGRYALYLTIGEEDAITEENILRIPMNIGADPDAIPIWNHIISAVGIFLAFVILVSMGLIMFSPILPLQHWVKYLTRAFLLSRYRS
ncbi:MAG: hypothetical protein WAU15_00405 [Nitrosomonas sp.]